MNWPEVADTALKIGLSAAIGGGDAIFVSKSARLHDFEKERRRRKQDSLERAIEDFDECELALDDYHILSKTAASFQDSPDLRVRAHVRENLLAAVDKAEAAEMKFRRSRSKLGVFGFRKCADALDAYSLAISKEKVALQPMRNAEEGWEGPLAAAHKERVRLALAFRETIEEALTLL